MQALQGKFSYLLNSRLGSDGNLENERQHLVQQQKRSKTRARKFLLETNRRRKALDERRKQWDIQEQRLRENILQQRRQQVQDATQRFQRAHLPPQRYRQTIRKNATNIEEALSQIQGSLGWYTQNNSLVSTANTRSCPLSTKPPTVSKSSQLHPLSAVEAYAKLLQEQCKIEELQDLSPEGSQLSDSCVSESLSSKDSLEYEDSNQSMLSPQSCHSSFVLNIENLRKRHDFTPTSDPTSVSAVMLLDQNPAPFRKVDEQEQEKQEETTFRLASEKQTSDRDNPLTLKDTDLLAIFTPQNKDSKHFEVKCLINSHSNNFLETNEVGAVNSKVEVLYPREDAFLDFRSQMIHDGGHLTYPSDKNIPFSSRNSILFATSIKKGTTNNGLNDKVIFNTEKEKFHLLSKKDTCVSINNLNKVSNLMYPTEKPINAASVHTSLSNIQSETEKCDSQKEDNKGIPVSGASTHSVCDVRFLKGILKNHSKYTPNDSCLYDSRRLILTKHIALAIRDSIELTRAKTKDVVVNDTAKKKIRWFDEVHSEKESKEQNTMKQDKDMSNSLSQPTNNSEDHPSCTEAGSSKPGPKMTPTPSAGYHFTKEAWTDVGVQVNLPQEQVDEVKTPRTSARNGGPRVPRRDRNARTGGGPVALRTRKGTVIRPQSATEVSQLAKTQGKILVPRPPPRTERTEENTAYISETPCTHHMSINYKQALDAEEATHRSNSAEIFSPNGHHPVPADPTVKYTMTPVSYTCPICPFSNSNAKGAPSSGHQETLNNRGRGKTNEKGLCLHSTPTDEEISQLWHGVRRALNTKDAKASIKKQVLESRRVCRKPHTEQNRQPPGSGSRRLLSSQSTNHKTELIRPRPRTFSTLSQNEGFESAAQLHMAEVHPEGLVKQNQVATQTQRSESEREGLSTLSLEEKKIMLSLDRLNHQLYDLKEHQGGRNDNNGRAIIGTPFTKEVKVSNNHKHRASSANHLQYQKKI